MKARIQKLKKLPNTHKGTASGLCDLVCVLTAIIVILICKFFKFEVTIGWVLCGVLVAKLIGVVIFFNWAKAVKKLAPK